MWIFVTIGYGPQNSKIKVAISPFFPIFNDMHKTKNSQNHFHQLFLLGLKVDFLQFFENDIQSKITHEI